MLLLLLTFLPDRLSQVDLTGVILRAHRIQLLSMNRLITTQSVQTRISIIVFLVVVSIYEIN